MIPSELQEQKAFIQWLQLKHIPYFAIPNGGKRTRWQAAQAKQEGMVAGAPDIAVILPDGLTLWIEMKRRKGGQISPAQKAFGQTLLDNGHHYRVCRGWEDAMEFVSGFLV